MLTRIELCALNVLLIKFRALRLSLHDVMFKEITFINFSSNK